WGKIPPGTWNRRSALQWPVLFLRGSPRRTGVGPRVPGAHCSMIRNKKPAVFGIEHDSVRVSDPGSVTLEQSQRGLVFFSVLPEHDHRAVMLQGEKHFFGGFVNGNPECSMGRVQFSCWWHIAFGVAVEDDQRIHCIVVDRVDVAGFGINIEAALKLDLRLEARNHPLWFGEPGARRSRGGPIV